MKRARSWQSTGWLTGWLIQSAGWLTRSTEVGSHSQERLAHTANRGWLTQSTEVGSHSQQRLAHTVGSHTQQRLAHTGWLMRTCSSRVASCVVIGRSWLYPGATSSAESGACVGCSSGSRPTAPKTGPAQSQAEERKPWTLLQIYSTQNGPCMHKRTCTKLHSWLTLHLFPGLVQKAAAQRRALGMTAASPSWAAVLTAMSTSSQVPFRL